MREWAKALTETVNRQDIILLAGLLLVGLGLAHITMALALAVPGLLLFLLGAGVFAPKGGK